MDAPISFIPAPSRRSRKRQPAATTSLTLVAATYDVAFSVTLKFNQSIDISHIQGPEIAVNDAVNNVAYAGLDGPATLVDPFTVRIELEVEGPATGPDNTLDAVDDNGIRTFSGAQEWAGVTELMLPYP